LHDVVFAALALAETLSRPVRDRRLPHVLNPSGAREAADASTERYRRGRSISSIDGMPIGIKDLIETKDMTTGHGCAAFAGNHATGLGDRAGIA
jgi:Asp-tRNA(Asn)/Glu-tRNA(Gln) amidotransferase A subunit family amidase